MRNSILGGFMVLGAATGAGCGGGEALPKRVDSPVALSEVKTDKREKPDDGLPCSCIDPKSIPTDPQEVRVQINSTVSDMANIFGGREAHSNYLQCLPITQSKCAPEGAHVMPKNDMYGDILWFGRGDDLMKIIKGGPNTPNETTKLCNRVLLACLKAVKQCTEEMEERKREFMTASL